MSLRLTRLLHAGLVRLDPDTLEPKPYLAKSWRWMDVSTLRVELRDDVRFHSGKPLRSDDVTETIKAFGSPLVHSRHASIVEPIGSVEADGDHAVVIHLKRPHATLVTDLELPILRADEAFGLPHPEGTLDGLGPFTLVHREGGEVELEDGSRHVVIRTVHDENARALRMHAGRADLVVNGFSPTLLPALADAPGLAVRSRPGANLTYLVARVDRGPLADADSRRAIAAAVDRERIAKTLFAGHATTATTLIPPAHWAYTPLPPSPSPSTHPPLHITLLTSTDRLRGTIARTVAQELADAGIETEVVPLELGTLLARLSAGDFEIAMLTMPELTEPNVLRVFLHSSSIPPAGANRGRLRDAEIDRLLDAGDATIDPAARKAIYAELEKRVRDVAAFIPLWHEDQVWVASDRARGFVPSAEGRWLSLAELH